MKNDNVPPIAESDMERAILGLIGNEGALRSTITAMQSNPAIFDRLISIREIKNERDEYSGYFASAELSKSFVHAAATVACTKTNGIDLNDFDRLLASSH